MKKKLFLNVPFLFFLGCFSYDPLPYCTNDIVVNQPLMTDVSRVGLSCNDSIISSKVNVADFRTEKLDSLVKINDELHCRITIDVLCEGEWFPYVEYDFSLNQGSYKDIRFVNDDYDGESLPIENKRCGIGERYVVMIREKSFCTD